MAPPSGSPSSQTTLITTLTSLLLLLLLLSSLPPPSSATTAPSPPPPRPFKKIYAFGDSYTDTGNTKSATGPTGFNFVSNLPYGRTFFHHPTNRYSDGRLVIDFVAQSLSLPYLPPYLDKNADKSMGVNFAVAGSTAIRHSFFVKNNLTLNVTPQSLQTQLNWFNKSMGEKGNEGISDDLFWVGEIGANDYAYTLGSSVTSSTIQKLAIQSVTGFLQALLTMGAKYIVVQGLPTTGCLPLALALAPETDRDVLGCVGSVNRQSYLHNSVLQSKLHELRSQFPHSVITYADYWNSYRTIVKNPSGFGFREPFKACCGSGGGPYNFQVFEACGSPSTSSCPDPSRFINWDGVHLTEAMYKAVSDSFLEGPFCHPSFEYLLSRKRNETGKQ